MKDAKAGMDVEVDIQPLLSVVFGFMIFSYHISSFSTLEIDHLSYGMVVSRITL